MSFKKLLKNVSNRDKMCTFGYIKRQEKRLNIASVPLMIQYYCLKYYYEFDEFEKCGSGMMIEENNRKITNKCDWPWNCWDAAYCKLAIDASLDINVIYKWKFKIESNAISIGIGIDSTYSALDHNIFDFNRLKNENDKFYCICSREYFYDSSIKKDKQYILNKKKRTFRKDYEITMKINLNNGAISFLNNYSGGRVATYIDKTKIYHVVVGSTSKYPGYIELIDFTTTYF